jgi:hypothetical protein
MSNSILAWSMVAFHLSTYTGPEVGDDLALTEGAGAAQVGADCQIVSYFLEKSATSEV